jgi:hypothetical protein
MRTFTRVLLAVATAAMALALPPAQAAVKAHGTVTVDVGAPEAAIEDEATYDEDVIYEDEDYVEPARVVYVQERVRYRPYPYPAPWYPRVVFHVGYHGYPHYYSGGHGHDWDRRGGDRGHDRGHDGHRGRH